MSDQPERRRPLVTTLRKLRKKYELSAHDVATSMGIEDNYLERIEDRGDCLVSELRRYAQAIGGDARVSVLMREDDSLYVIDVGYQAREEEVPEIHGVDMPALPRNVSEIAPFEAELKRIDEAAYAITCDREIDRRDRAMAFSARESVALLRKVVEHLRPRLEAMEEALARLLRVDDDESDVKEKLSALLKVDSG